MALSQLAPLPAASTLIYVRFPWLLLCVLPTRISYHFLPVRGKSQLTEENEAAVPVHLSADWVTVTLTLRAFCVFYSNNRGNSNN